VLHRPVSRRSIYLTKLITGLIAYLLCGAAPILLYAFWAATAGTHASPFDWSMTLSVWSTWLATITVYFGAFLAGIRPAAWIGTRLAPLAAAGGILAVNEAVLVHFPGAMPAVLYPLLLIGANLALVASILHTVEARDFA